MKYSFLYGCFCCCLSMANTAHSQTLTYNPTVTANNFIGTMPNAITTDSRAFRKFLIEYGDGSYAIMPVSSHSTVAGTAKKAFGYAYYMYDTTHRPVNIIMNYRPSTKTMRVETFSELAIPIGKQVFFNSLVRDLRPLEKTHFYCAYYSNKTILAIFYNQQNASFFRPIVDTAETFSDGTNNIRLIRCYNGQSIYTEAMIESLISKLGSTSVVSHNLQITWTRAQSLGFKNALFICDTNINNKSKKNIFLTLFPPAALSGYDYNARDTTYIKVQTIPFANSSRDSTGMALNLTSAAHDPHLFRITKECKPASSSQAVYHYSLDFSNNGLGATDNVSVSLEMPAAANIDLLKSGMVTSIFSDDTIHFIRQDLIFTDIKNKPAALIVPYFKIVNPSFKGSKPTIIFYFQGLRLPGTRDVGSYSSKLDGHIRFTLPNKLNMPDTDMNATSHVYFGDLVESMNAYVRTACIPGIFLSDDIQLH